jgi:predicted ATPase
MMMAHDSTPGRSDLAAETIDAVRSALLQFVETPSDGEPLRRALDAMAAEAHAKSILPEQLLIILKDVWHALPNVASMRDPAEQSRLLRQVVTICIKEYFGN